MEKKMNALCLIPGEGVKLQQVRQPESAKPGHLLIKMQACAINPGDKAFIKLPLPPGSVLSLYDVYGVSGAGTVIATGDGVPEAYRGKKVSMYRSLKSSESMIGTWCEYAHMHYLDCIILPDDAVPEEYAGSVPNAITPYGFLQQVSAEGHKGILSTAGTSATGIAMLGICLANNFPLISIVRNEAGKKELAALGATHIVVQNDPAFRQQVQEFSKELSATAIFDGVGGEVLNKIIEVIPNNAAIYLYGYLGDAIPLTVHTRTLSAKGITIRPFINFRTETVMNPQRLEKALQDLGAIFHQPHFKTKPGPTYSFAEINDALAFTAAHGEKPILSPSA